MFKNWSWEDTIGTIILSIVIALATCGILVLMHPQEITYYYGSDKCVEAHWTWHSDQQVLCPQDLDKLPDYIARFNATLPAKDK